MSNLASSPLTSNSPTPILEQTWVSKTDVPSKDSTLVGPEGALLPGSGATPPMPPARARDYTALTISHSAPASKQTSFERGESVERVRPLLAGQGSTAGMKYSDAMQTKCCLPNYTIVYNYR